MKLIFLSLIYKCISLILNAKSEVSDIMSNEIYLKESQPFIFERVIAFHYIYIAMLHGVLGTRSTWYGGTSFRYGGTFGSFFRGR